MLARSMRSTRWPSPTSARRNGARRRRSPRCCSRYRCCSASRSRRRSSTCGRSSGRSLARPRRVQNHLCRDRPARSRRGVTLPGAANAGAEVSGHSTNNRGRAGRISRTQIAPAARPSNELLRRPRDPGNRLPKSSRVSVYCARNGNRCVHSENSRRGAVLERGFI